MEKLFGKRVLINIPEMKESTIQLNDSDKEALQKEAIKKWSQLEVFAIGDEVEKVQVGDKVYVQGYGLEGAEKVEIDGAMKLMVKEFDIAFKY